MGSGSADMGLVRLPFVLSDHLGYYAGEDSETDCKYRVMSQRRSVTYAVPE